MSEDIVRVVFLLLNVLLLPSQAGNDRENIIMRKAAAVAAIGLALGMGAANHGNAQAAALANAPACEDYATLAHHLDPAHNYVCVNKADDVWGYDNCEAQGRAWHPVKFWCTNDPWPTWDLDGVVITR